MRVYALRGAITCENTVDSMLSATKELLNTLISDNQLQEDDLISMFFTTTRDLNAVFPARAARELGFKRLALMCAHEMSVPQALQKCVRVMIHVNAPDDFEPQFVYLRGAKKLRPDLFK